MGTHLHGCLFAFVFSKSSLSNSGLYIAKKFIVNLNGEYNENASDADFSRCNEPSGSR